METPVQQRLNITFGKSGALKYIGHLDVAKVWERVLRRADLPILYTQGFNTRPRMQLASALPLGITSECEILDVALREKIALEGVAERITGVSPDGLRTYQVEAVAIDGPPLQPLVISSEYRIHLEDDHDQADIKAAVAGLMEQDRIVKVKTRKNTKRKSTFDLRSMIYDLYVDDQGDIIAHLAAGERGNLHPRDLMEELGYADAFYSIHRFRLHLDDYYDRLKGGQG
ncbi:MAG: hypothetical protein OHK0046_01670 [Anaerolineae bacterium]